MKKEKRFSIKFNYGNWQVIDKMDNKMVVAFSKKSDAEITSDGLNRIRKKENILNMKSNLKTTKGYSHFISKK